MGGWLSYRLGDFVPFTPEVYMRLIERVNEAFWPLQGLTVALGVAALLLALRGYQRLSLVLLAPIWIGCAVIFHFGYYGELNWAASWFGWAFIVEALLVLIVAALPADLSPRRPLGRRRIIVAAALAAIGTIAYPFVAVVAGKGWTHAEIIGLHPDPTAIATLGVLLLARHGAILACLITIPAAACLLGTLTLIPLDIAWAPLPVAAVIACLLALAFDAGVRRRDAVG